MLGGALLILVAGITDPNPIRRLALEDCASLLNLLPSDANADVFAAAQGDICDTVPPECCSSVETGEENLTSSLSLHEFLGPISLPFHFPLAHAL